MKSTEINLIDKYLPSKEKVDYLVKFLSSFANTFIERYGKVDLENLYSYNAPIYFEEYEQLKNKIFTKVDEKNRNKKRKDIKSFFPIHLSLNLDKKDLNIIENYCFLRMNESLFLVELNTHFRIKILLPFYTEQIELEFYQEDFNLLLDGLEKDFKF